MEFDVYALILAFLESGIPLILVAFLLNLIPGPWRGIANSLFAWGMSAAKKNVEETRQRQASTAVLSAEQVIGEGNGEAKLGYALDKLTTFDPLMPDDVARVRIEAEVRTLKERQAREAQQAILQAESAEINVKLDAAQAKLEEDASFAERELARRGVPQPSVDVSKPLPRGASWLEEK